MSIFLLRDGLKHSVYYVQCRPWVWGLIFYPRHHIPVWHKRREGPGFGKVFQPIGNPKPWFCRPLPRTKYLLMDLHTTIGIQVHTVSFYLSSSCDRVGRSWLLPLLISICLHAPPQCGQRKVMCYLQTAILPDANAEPRYHNIFALFRYRWPCGPGL